MKRFLGAVVALSLIAGLALAQDKTVPAKPAAPKPEKTEGVEKVQKPEKVEKLEKVEKAEKAAKDDCCSGDQVKEKTEDCSGGCGDCADAPMDVKKPKAPAGAEKAKTPAVPKTAKAPKAK
jgi:hypothetical protein